jgi:hypothetical protein
MLGRVRIDAVAHLDDLDDVAQIARLTAPVSRRRHA